MSSYHTPEPLVSEDIAHLKQDSRDQDAADLASGRKTRKQLRAENGAFNFPRVRIHYGSAHRLR